jgi:TPR repeat protein
LFKLAADQGNAGAQNNLGKMYVEGRGVPPSDLNAIKYFRMAADQGDPIGIKNLHTMLTK